MSRRIAFVIAALGVSVAGTASALSLDLTSSGSTGLGAQVTFTASFTPSTPVTGYDVTIAWDPAELTYNSATPIFGSFFAAMPDPSKPTGTRVASALPAPSGVSAGDLFSVTFVVASQPEDGLFDDFKIWVDSVANGAGVGSPVGQNLMLDNPEGFSADVSAAGVQIVGNVPEPSTLTLLATTLVGFALRRRRAL